MLVILLLIVLNNLTRLKKRLYLIRQDDKIYTFSIKLSLSSFGQDNSKLQKQIVKLLILTETVAF